MVHIDGKCPQSHLCKERVLDVKLANSPETKAKDVEKKHQGCNVSKQILGGTKNTALTWIFATV